MLDIRTTSGVSAVKKDEITTKAHELDDLQLELLESIAYCAKGMFVAESERNFGDAKEWKFRLKQEVDKYSQEFY